jgi:hypothetical protein
MLVVAAAEVPLANIITGLPVKQARLAPLSGKGFLG